MTTDKNYTATNEEVSKKNNCDLYFLRLSDMRKK